MLSQSDIFSLLNSEARAVGQMYPVANYEQLVDLLDASRKKDNAFYSFGLARILEERFPQRARGYVDQYEVLLNLSLPEHAIQTIERAEKNGLTYHKYIYDKRSDYHARFREHDIAIKMHTSSKNTTRSIAQRAYDSAIEIKDFKTAFKIADYLGQEFQNITKSKFHKWNSELEQLSINLESTSLQSLLDAVTNQETSKAICLTWCLYNLNINNTEFFDICTEPYYGEMEHAPRLAFFRYLANSIYPTRYDYANKYSKSLLYQKRVYLAFELISQPDHALSHDETLIRQTAYLLAGGDALHPLHAENGNQKLSGLERTRARNIHVWNSSKILSTPNHGAYDELFIENNKKNRPSFLANPKVAICVSGQLRSFTKNWPNLKAIIDSLNADLFIHTWDEERVSPPLFRRLERFLGHDLLAHLPNELRESEKFNSALPETTKYLRREFSKAISRCDLEFTGAKEIEIDNEQQFEETIRDKYTLRSFGKFNQAKMFYKMFKCDCLRESHEIKIGSKYDCVIRIRPDLDISIPNIKKIVQLCLEDKQLVFSHYCNHDGIGDQMIITSSEAASLIYRSWPLVERKKSFALVDGFSPLGAEWHIANLCYAYGLKPRLMPSIKPRLITELVIDKVDIREPLALDTALTNDRALIEFRNQVNKYYENRDQ